MNDTALIETREVPDNEPEGLTMTDKQFKQIGRLVWVSKAIIATVISAAVAFGAYVADQRNDKKQTATAIINAQVDIAKIKEDHFDDVIWKLNAENKRASKEEVVKVRDDLAHANELVQALLNSQEKRIAQQEFTSASILQSLARLERNAGTKP